MRRATLAHAGNEPGIKLSATPAAVASSDQVLADQLAQKIKTSGAINNYNVDLTVEGGVVTVEGRVGSESDRSKIKTMLSAMPGVVAVNNKATIALADGVERTAFQAAAPAGPGPMDNAGLGVSCAPAPTTAFAGGVMPFSDAPAMPGYSWPAYTPYNNYASMAYQTQYPNGAWPYIGPPYPYPMIPAGWRHVSLRWSRGYWFMKFHSH